MQPSAKYGPTKASREAVAAALSRLGTRRFSSVEFLVVLVVWLVSVPIIMHVPHGDLAEAVLATAVMLSAVVALGGRRRTLIAATLLAAPACAGKWFNHFRPDICPPQVHTVAGIVFLAFVVVHLLRFILLTPRVNAEVLCAGVSGYLLLGILWSLAYALTAQLAPGSFVFAVGQDRAMIGTEALYFSFVTLCTVGYGDIVPASPVSRMLAVFEAAAGTMYVTVLIARLVSLYSSAKPSCDEGR